MGLISIISKLVGVEAKVEWSRCKKIHMAGPDAWGQYDVFVDSNFNVALFIPGASSSLLIFAGNVVEATVALKYDSDGTVVMNGNLERGDLEWKINPSRILFRGRVLSGKMMSGNVVGAEAFEGDITPLWIDQRARDIARSIAQERDP